MEKYKILIIVFTDTKLTSTVGIPKYAYYTEDPSIKPGDHFKSSRDGRWVQVVEVRNSETTFFNGKPLNKIDKMENGSKMIAGIKEKYMSQYIPEKVPNAKLSADGAICVLIGNEYVGMKGEELTTYPEEFIIDSIPVYSISKLQSKVQPGEIVVSGKSFGKVISKNPDGSLKILSFSGYTHNKKEVKDFMLGQATVRVLVNMFDLESDCGFNPLVFAAISGDGFDLKTLAMMQMMPGASSTKNPMTDLFKNPAMMAMMMKGDGGGKNDLLESMMFMGMMGGSNPFSPHKKETTSTTEDVMKDLLEEDPEFKKAFVKAMKKRSKKGGEN